MAKKKVDPLSGEGCRIRLLEEGDLEQVRSWRNQDHIRVWFVHQEKISSEQQIQWWNKYKDRDDDYVFIIEETLEELGPIGLISIYHIDWDAKRAEYGRLVIGEAKARGKQLARKASDLVLKFAFENLNLNEVYLEVFEDNAPAIKVYEKCGFEKTGLKDRLLQMRILAHSKNRN